MWANFLRFVPGAGVRLGEVAALAAIVNLAGLQRWGYVTVGPDPADGRAKPPRRDWVVRITAAGQRAQSVWQPLTAAIERRWQQRFGTGELAALTGALHAVASQITLDLPPYLPVAGVYPADHGAWFAAGRQAGRAGGTELPALLSRVLLAFAVEVECESPLSMVAGAGLLRVLGTDPVPIASLPIRAGLSREAVSVARGWLERRGYAVSGPDPAAGRGRVARLTRRGQQAQDDHRSLVSAVEQRWRDPVRRGHRQRAGPLVARPVRCPGRAAADRGRAGALPGWLAGPSALPQPDPGHRRRPGRRPAALPDGVAPRRLPGRQLTRASRRDPRPETHRPPPSTGQAPGHARLPRVMYLDSYVTALVHSGHGSCPAGTGRREPADNAGHAGPWSSDRG
jgi:DNA-binding MarR family transcriptional regulator